MKKSVLLSLVFLIICLPVVFAPPPASCGGSVVCTCGLPLTSSRTLNASDALTNCGGIGLTIQTSGITLDCAGYTINSTTNTSYGIQINNVSGVSVQNCNVSHFGIGIHAQDSKLLTIKNNILENNGGVIPFTGLHFDDVNQSNVTNNSINLNDYGIFLNLSNGNTFTGNNVTNNTYQAVYGNYSANNTFTGGEVGNNNQGCCAGVGFGGMSFDHSPGTTIRYVYLHNNVQGAINLRAYSYDSVVEHDNIDRDSGGSFQVDSSFSNNLIIQYNNVTNGTGNGIDLLSSNQTQIRFNNISGNNNIGIHISASDGLQIKNNVIDNNNNSGLYIFGGGEASNHVITDNDVRKNCFATASCAGLTAELEDNTSIEQNNVSQNFGGGILLKRSFNITVSNNTVSNNTKTGINVSLTENAFPGGNNTIRNNSVSFNFESGIATNTTNNTISDNTITGDVGGIGILSVVGYYSGIDIRGTNGQDANGNYLSGNEISGYQYGLYVLQNITNLTVNAENYHNNSVNGIYFNNVGTSAAMPLITSSTINNDCEGIGLYNGSFATVTETNVMNNNCTIPGTGLFSDFSHADVTNGNFENNGASGMVDLGGDSINWLITKSVACTNNNIQLFSGFIVPFGGRIVRTNCTVSIWNGTAYVLLPAGNEGRYTEGIDTSNNNTYTAGSPNYGFTGEIHTNSSSTGVFNLNFFSSPPGNATFKVGPLGIWVEVNVTGNVTTNLTYWTLRIYYTDAQVAAAGLTASSLKISYFNVTSNAWQDLPSIVNTAGHYVEANITHFSTFGMFGSGGSSSGMGGGGGGGAYYPSVLRPNATNVTTPAPEPVSPPSTEAQPAPAQAMQLRAQPPVPYQSMDLQPVPPKKSSSWPIIVGVLVVLVGIGVAIMHKKPVKQ